MKPPAIEALQHRPPLVCGPGLILPPAASPFYPACMCVCVCRVHAGGRVSDSFDQHVLTTYLEEYFGDFLFDAFQPFHFYQGRDGHTIGVPPKGPRDIYIKAIDALPLVQSPEVSKGALRWPSATL